MPASPVLIAAKLLRPSTRPNLIPRPRLFTRLAAAPITLITAPAGFGKTTLVTAWLSQQPALRAVHGSDDLHPSSLILHPSAWLSLDPDDNDLPRCLAYLVAALTWDDVVVETDSPYLAPAPLRGKRNEPAYVEHTFKALLAARNDLDPEAAARRLWDNFRRKFPRFQRSYETAPAR